MGMDGRREASEEALRVFHSCNPLARAMTQSLANIVFLKGKGLPTQEEVRKNVASLMAQELLDVEAISKELGQGAAKK